MGGGRAGLGRRGPGAGGRGLGAGLGLGLGAGGRTGARRAGAGTRLRHTRDTRERFANASRTLRERLRTLANACERLRTLRGRFANALAIGPLDPKGLVDGPRPCTGARRSRASRASTIEAKCPYYCSTVNWKVAEDPVLHCLEGEGLLLTGYPGTGKTYLARQIVTALREEGYKVKIITKTHSSVQNFGMQAETADHWARSTVRNGYCNIDWLVAEEITQLDTGLWNDIACVSMNRKIKFLLLGDFRQFPAIMDNFAGTPVLRELKHCQLLHDLTGGWHHELTDNMRSDRASSTGSSPWPRHSRRPEKDSRGKASRT